MLGSLPAELAVAILIEAAERFIVADRATTVSLALTGRYVYNIVRPILLRRVCIIDSNYYLIDDTLTNGGAGALVKDINVLTGDWVPTQEAVSCLSNLQCLRGTSHIVEAIIEMLPQSARKSLWSLELWSKQTIRRIPAGITHLCLYGYVLQTSSLDALVVWLCRAPSITHIGIDVIIEDTTFDALQENLPLGFQRVLEVGGSRLQTIAARIQGGSVSNGDWERLLETMLSWSRNNEMAAMQADRRVALWREGRIFDDWRDETRAALDDCLAAIDLWTEACSLAEWTETVRVL